MTVRGFETESSENKSSPKTTLRENETTLIENRPNTSALDHINANHSPNQTFAGFIAAGSKKATEQLTATLQGKIVGITGTIEVCAGKPEIKVISIDQIKGLPLERRAENSLIRFIYFKAAMNV